MKQLHKNLETKNIKAETLLALLDDIPDLKVQNESIFSRNYSDEVINIDNDQDRIIVSLSRNGIFHLLPKGLFFTENHLKKERKKGNDFKDAYCKINKQKEDAQTFFQPFDTELFKLSLELELKLNHLYKKGNAALRDDTLNIPNNQYINKLIPLLPYASNLRGNIPLLTDLLKVIFEVKKIEIKEIKPLYTRFYIHKKDLNRDQYFAMDSALKHFFEIFHHHFLPVEKKYDFKIIDITPPFQLGDSLILDYNTHF